MSGSYMSEQTLIQHSKWGLGGFVIGMAALVLVMLTISGVFDPPAKSAGTTIGEIAAEIRNSAKQALTNGPSPTPEPVQTSLSFKEIAMIAAPVLAGLAAICGAVGLFRNEDRTLPMLAISAGTCAFMMQYVFLLALLIGGVILLCSIMANIGGILGE